MEKVRELIVTQQVGGSQVMPNLGFPLRAPKTWPPAEGGESWAEEWRGAERLLLATLVGKWREGKGSLKPAPWKRRLRAESPPHPPPEASKKDGDGIWISFPTAWSA